MKIRISFGKTSIADMIKLYKNIAENTDELKENIIDDLKRIGLKEINNSIGSSKYEASEPIAVIEEKNAIGIKGTQAVYDEYGTGTIGGLNPHPEKPSFLNAYNSGSTIRPNEKGKAIRKNDGLGGMIPPNTLYWTFHYKDKKIYTQGRPAGMHVYKAKKQIKENLEDIVKKRVGEYLSKR